MIAETWDAEPISSVIGDIVGDRNKTAEMLEGRVGVVNFGRTHDGTRRLSCMRDGHSAGKLGRSTPHSSRLDDIRCLIEKWY